MVTIQHTIQISFSELCNVIYSIRSQLTSLLSIDVRREFLLIDAVRESKKKNFDQRKRTDECLQ
jgi:hypothetical protein